MFVFQMPAEFSKIDELNRLQMMIIFKQLSVLPFLLENFTACLACFQFRKNVFFFYFEKMS